MSTVSTVYKNLPLPDADVLSGSVFAQPAPALWVKRFKLSLRPEVSSHTDLVAQDGGVIVAL